MFSTAMGLTIVLHEAHESWKDRTPKPPKKVKEKPVEWDAHLEIPAAVWYQDLTERVDQCKTLEELERFDPSAYGMRKDFMGYNYQTVKSSDWEIDGDGMRNPFRGTILPREDFVHTAEDYFNEGVLEANGHHSLYQPNIAELERKQRLDWEKSTQAIEFNVDDSLDTMDIVWKARNFRPLPYPYRFTSPTMQRYYRAGYPINHQKTYNDKLMRFEHYFVAVLPSGKKMAERVIEP